MKSKNRSIGGKLKSYSALAGSLLAISSSSDAQVVYTDIIDYTGTLNGDAYDLDLNNDGTNDFRIARIDGTYSGYSYTEVTVSRNGSNQIARVGTAVSSTSASALALNTPINSGNGWVNANNTNSGLMGLIFGGTGSYGPWLGVQNLYLGLKLIKGSNTYYGWARCDVNATATQFVIKDYAYESTPGKQILAGSKISSVKENSAPEFSVYSFDKQLTIELAIPSHAEISIKNVLGEEIKSVITNDKKTQVDLNDAPSGVYFATVSTREKTSTIKVFLK